MIKRPILLVLIGVVLLCGSLLIILPLIHTKLSPKDVKEVFFPNILELDVEELKYIGDFHHAGYVIYAKARLDKKTIKKILTGTKNGTYEFDNNDPENMKAWRLVSEGIYGDFSIMERLNPLQCQWWKLDDLSQADIYLAEGNNSLTSSFTHWWLVPHNEENVIYLIGSGI